jgi:hypothetical protein
MLEETKAALFSLPRQKRRARILRCRFQILEQHELAHLMLEETKAALFSLPGQKNREYESADAVFRYWNSMR